MGYKVIRFTNAEVLHNVENVIEKVKNHLSRVSIVEILGG